MAFLLLLKSHVFAFAQATLIGSTLTGVVFDPNGAFVDHATVHIHGKGVNTDVMTDREGRFALNVPAGTYEVTVQYPGFETYAARGVQVHLDEPFRMSVRLKIEAVDVSVNVGAETISTEGAANRSALVFKGDDLEALADTDDAFQQQLLALAGGAGIRAPQVYVDGFSGGKIPPKSSIREVRINQNPFSAQYDSIGIGRIEVLTKPGGEKFHGAVYTGGNSDALNSQNPYATNTPPYHSLYVNGNLSGPMGRRTSFYAGENYVDVDSVATVNATTLDASLQPVAFSQAVPLPTRTGSFAFRADHQLTKDNTFTGRYSFDVTDVKNSGVGLLVLPSQGLNVNTKVQTLQLSDTQMIGATKVNETRFQYMRTRAQQTPASSAAAVIVQGAFSGGGNPQQSYTDHRDNYEFQEYFSIALKSHFLRLGGRYRLTRDANDANANFNSTYVYSNLAAYQKAQAGTPGGGPSQYSVTVGATKATVMSGDVGLYAEDEWKSKRNLTLNYGLRFESQSGIPDHVDFAPRAGAAWAVHQSDKRAAWVVLRAGAGIYYDRFAVANMLTAVRQNGISQRTYYRQYGSLLNSPMTNPTIYRVSPTLHSPYAAVAMLSADKRLPKLGSVSASYMWVRGVHQFLSRNANAPLNGVRPLGGNGNVYQFSSDGDMHQQILFVNANMNAAKRFSVFAYGAAQWQNSDAGGATTFVSDQYDIALDYGRVAEPRLQFYTGGWFHLPYGINAGPFLAVRSGARFNITIGSDINLDTQYNDRPAFATDLSRPSVVKTVYGNFDTSPLSTQQRIPINYGAAPNFVALQLQANKGFKFGPQRDAKGTKPYEAGFSINVMNALNHRNPGTPVGVLSSPAFGQSVSLAAASDGTGNANRVVNLRGYFSF